MNSWIEIDSDALQNNYDIFQSMLGPSRMAPVLKSNAYGHGLKITYECLREKAPQWICVNYAYEADELRKLGFRGRILLVGPTFATDLEYSYEVDADVVLVSSEQLELWTKLKHRPNIHIKVDTGMHRQGFLSTQLPELISSLGSFKNEIKAVCTHFANVEDVLDQEFALSQLRSIESAASLFQKSGFTVNTHAAASASALILPESRLDMGRVGISLYGFWPSSQTRLSYLQQNNRICELRPALTWKTKVSQIKALQPGEYVGYGLTFKAPRPMKIAVLPVGYNEGYPRLAGDHQSYVIVGGKRAAVVGRICMNMMMVDVTHIDGVEYEDEVILIGKHTSTEEEVSAFQLGDWSRTIHYEALTRLHHKIPRILKTKER